MFSEIFIQTFARPSHTTQYNFANDGKMIYFRKNSNVSFVCISYAFAAGNPLLYKHLPS